MNIAYQQTMRDGQACSIDDRVNKGIWSQPELLVFWDEAAAALPVQHLWKKADSWVKQLEKKPGHITLVDEVRGLCQELL